MFTRIFYLPNVFLNIIIKQLSLLITINMKNISEKNICIVCELILIMLITNKIKPFSYQ